MSNHQQEAAEPSGGPADTSRLRQFERVTTTLEPGRSKSLGLGAYSSSEPEPVFDFRFDPDMREAITTSLERLEIPGKARRMHLCRLRNTSDTRCQVTVMRRTGEAD